MGRNAYVKRRTNKRKVTLSNDALMLEALKLPEVINQSTCWKAYHLDESQCALHVPPNPRVKNCRTNPYCIHRLGLEKIEKLKNQQSDTVAPDLVRRNLNKQPCGLVNFGNFCYVNSFLQIWYNDLVFRQCIYDWRPDPTFVQPDGTKMDVQAVMNCMQELFLTMQFTPFETTNALELIRLLKLDNEQHDVQEFNTVFFDALDRNLERHPNGASVRRVIQSRFESRIRQTIECDFCGSKSDTESEYRSLQISIDGHKSLISAIEGFFSPESLSDYKCDGCRKSGSVTRYSHFSKLPPILIIQFNRYVFDSNGRHKKLKAPIQYPRTLPEMVLQPDLSTDSGNYDLCAVMIHEGPNTHCGHYYDLIKSPVDDQWFTYNDKQVVQTKPPGVSVEKENIPRATTDMKECYALIYQRADAHEGVTLENMRLPPPDFIAEVQKNLNDKFSKESRDGDTSANLWKSQVETRCSFLQKLWAELEVKNGKAIAEKDLTFLPTLLLTEILAKEFQAVKEMRSLEEFTPPSPPKLENDVKKAEGDENLPIKEEKKTDEEIAASLERKNDEESIHLYSVERLEEGRMSLCVHDKVSLYSLFKGDVKAVNRAAAERLMKYYRIELSADLQKDQGTLADNFRELRSHDCCSLRTGNDICVECVKLIKKEANFKKNLDKTSELPMMKELRARTFNVLTSKKPESTPPPNSLWVSEKHLRFFRKHALEQMEYSKISKELVGELVFTARNAPQNLGKKSSSAEDVIDLTSEKNGDEPNGWPNSPCSSTKSSNNNRKRKLGATASVNEEEQEWVMDNGDDENGLANGFGEPTHSSAKEHFSNGCLSNRAGPSNRAYTPDRAVPSRRGKVNCSPSPSNSDECEIVMDVVGSRLTNGNGRERSSNEKAGSSNYDLDEDQELDQMEIEVCSPTKSTNGDDGPKKPVKFNSDLYCKHGRLTFLVKRTWITPEEWEILRENFYDYCDPIPQTTNECEKCIAEYCTNQDEQASRQEKIEQILIALNKTMRLIDRRKTWDNMELGICYTHVLCPKFIKHFMRLMKSNKNSEIPRICQECLLCEHGQPYLILDDQDSNCAAGVPVMLDEWRQLADVFDALTPYGRPHEIRLAESGGYPSICAACSDKHIEDENNKRFVYPDGKDIYVKVKGDESDEKEKETKSTAAVTTRRLAAKNLLKFKMCSTERVLDLKLRIYEHLKQSPNDQLLYLNNMVLENEQTLGSARVDPNNVDNPIILIVQQAVDVMNGSLGSGEPRQLEKGFRDTALAI